MNLSFLNYFMVVVIHWEFLSNVCSGEGVQYSLMYRQSIQKLMYRQSILLVSGVTF